MALQRRGERLLAGAARRLLGDRRLLIATNRGPVTFSANQDGAGAADWSPPCRRSAGMCR
jgi:hypothetical protein